MKKILFLFLTSALLSACTNVLDDSADKDSPEALFYNAQMKMNDKNYDEAITLLEELDPLFLARRDVGLIYASAYSGRCGLEFLEIIDSLDLFDGSNSIFLPFMQLQPGGTDSRIADCVKSEDVLKSVGDETVRNGDENVLMGLSSLTKVGVVLSRFADINGDGTLDVGFDHCNITQLPDDAVREVGTGVALGITSIANSGAAISPASLSSITNFCQLNAQLNVFCTATQKSDFNALQVAALRAVIGSTNQGIGACPGDFTACVCP